jgi:predicted  nucleic acid-binding Zn-ribbon protein
VPYYRCTESECGKPFYDPSQFVDQCPECGGDAVPFDADEGPTDHAPLVVPGGRAREELAHPAHARERARRLLVEYNITRPPVPVLAIARKAGFEVVEKPDLGSLSARLCDDRIEVSAGESESRKRFSIAHELGHHFLHTHHGSGSTAEREADAFAGELLVPGHMLRAAIVETQSVEELRRVFRVSRQVIEIAAETHRLAGRLR